MRTVSPTSEHATVPGRGSRRWAAPVIVGVGDASGAAQQAALSFAATEANRRRADVVLVHGCEPLTTATAPAPVQPMEERRRLGWELVAAAAEQLAPLLDPARQIERRVTAATGAATLVALSATASIVVVQRRTISGLSRLHTGSTSSRVCAQAASAVAVLRSGDDQLPDRHAVVVGVDSQGHAEAALPVAFAEAALRHQPLLAVHAWEMPGPVSSYTYVPPAPEELAAQRERALSELAEAMAGYAEDYPDVLIRKDAVRAGATEALLEASAKAQLLVVGRHRRRGIGSFGLGSVARHCLQHAGCPVVVAPPGD